jgi:hypothetical protein
MEIDFMFTTRKTTWKFQVIPIILLQICLAFLLSSCEATASCNLQAVAGGAQYCEHFEVK